MMKFVLTLMAVAMQWLCLDVKTHAADDESKSIEYPLVLINAPNVKRWHEHADYMFSAAQCPNMTNLMEKWINSTLKDFSGIDQNRPFGLMVYLPFDFVSWKIPIVYIPVTNLDDALKTLANDQGAVTSVDGKFGWNNIRYSADFLVRTRLVGNYLFLAMPDADDTTLDRIFPDPAKLAARLSGQYDIAASLLLRYIQPAMKKLFMESMRQALLANLQQRDDEPESAYRLRRANGEGWIEMLDHVVSHGDEFTVGARLSPDKHQASFDIDVAGFSDNKLAKFFQGMAGKRTHFGNLLTNPSTFTISVSLQLSDKQRPLLFQFFEAAKKDIGTNATKAGTAGVNTVVDPMIKVLQASAEAGHIDVFVQLVGNDPGKMALIAGAKLSGSKNFPTQVTELLSFAKNNANGNELLSRLELTASEIDSYPVHQLEINPPDKPGQRMFGETAHLNICAMPQAIWFSFGGDAALETLRESISQAALPQDPTQSRTRAPVVFVTHMNNWLSLDDRSPKSGSFGERARASFDTSNDSIQLALRPTDAGVRLRIEFEEGFVALLGRGIANRIENGGPLFRNGQDQPAKNDEPGGNSAGKKPAPVTPQSR